MTRAFSCIPSHRDGVAAARSILLASFSILLIGILSAQIFSEAFTVSSRRFSLAPLAPSPPAACYSATACSSSPSSPTSSSRFLNSPGRSALLTSSLFTPTSTSQEASSVLHAAVPVAPSPGALKAVSPSSASPDTPAQHNIFSQSLRGILRGHKCLFDDSHLPNGSLSFLFRGADSSQRYVYPLELETNRSQLPGAEAANIMFLEKDNAMQFARNNVFGSSRSDGRGKFGLRRDDSGMGEIVYEDIGRFHRVLQYGVAAGLTSFMREEVMWYNADLYAEIGMNFDALIFGVESLAEFYSGHIRGKQWTDVFEPAIHGILQKLLEIKANVASRSPPSPAGDVTAPSFQHSQWPESWEEQVDPRTLVPLLVDVAN